MMLHFTWRFKDLWMWSGARIIDQSCFIHLSHFVTDYNVLNNAILLFQPNEPDASGNDIPGLA